MIAIVTNNASKYKEVGKVMESKYPKITWAPSTPHTLSMHLKDFEKVLSIKQTLLDASVVVKFIKEDLFYKALFRTKLPTKDLQIFCAT